MDLTQYNRIKEALSGSFPRDSSRFAIYRFKKRCERYYLKDDQIWVRSVNESHGDKILVPINLLTNCLKLEYEDPRTMSNGQMSFFNIIHGKYEGISFAQVRDFLKAQKTYQLHKPPQRDRVIQPVMALKPGTYIQLDTINLEEYGFQNNGVKYALTAVDVFSKFAWVVPQKTLRAAETLASFKKILKDLPELRTIQTDNGTEFQAEFTRFIDETLINGMHIKHNHSISHTPQAQGQIERFNKTIKQLIHQYMTMYNTKVWVPAIDSLVWNYNNRAHSTTKQKPAELLKAGNSEINRASALQRIVDINLSKIRAQSRTLAKGDKVRILKSALSAEFRKAQASKIGKGSKSYIKQWSDEIYEITSHSTVTVRGINHKITLYRVKGDASIQTHRFRQDQLQHVPTLHGSPEDSLQKADLKKYSIDFTGFGREK